jgi:hypothetical protein
MVDKIPHSHVALLLQQLKDSYPSRATELREGLLKSGLKEATIAKLLKMKIGKPQLDDMMVPCLAEGHAIRASAMLGERFRFAGSVEDISGHFLSIQEMGALLKKKKFRELVKAQAENWEGCAPATIPFERLSVFSVRSLDDGNLTYIVWPAREASEIEPQFWEYLGHSEARYKNLADYLKHLCA